MLKKKSRISKLLVLCLAITLIFSFNTAFGITLPSDHVCNPYGGDVTKDSAATQGNITGAGMTGSGDGTFTVTIGDSEIMAVVEGTAAHITVIKGSLAKVAVKAANSYRCWYFNPNMQAGECCEVTSAGCFSNGGNEKETIGEQALHGISHLVFFEGTVVEQKGSIQIEKAYLPQLEGDSDLPQATFQLYDEDYNAVEGGETTINGEGSGAIDDLELGDYYLKETDCPDGYALSVKVGDTALTPDEKDFWSITVDSSTAVVVSALNTKEGVLVSMTGTSRICRNLRRRRV